MSHYLTKLNALPRERLEQIAKTREATPGELANIVSELLSVRDEDEVKLLGLLHSEFERLGLEPSGQSILHPHEREVDGGALHTEPFTT